MEIPPDVAKFCQQLVIILATTLSLVENLDFLEPIEGIVEAFVKYATMANAGVPLVTKRLGAVFLTCTL